MMLYFVLPLVLEFNDRRGSIEVAGWTVDQTIQVRFPVYPYRMWAL